MGQRMQSVKNPPPENIYSKEAEEHLEKILIYCLIRRDYNEFMIEWATTKTDHMLENSLLDESDDMICNFQVF